MADAVRTETPRTPKIPLTKEQKIGAVRAIVEKPGQGREHAVARRVAEVQRREKERAALEAMAQRKFEEKKPPIELSSAQTAFNENLALTARVEASLIEAGEPNVPTKTSDALERAVQFSNQGPEWYKGLSTGERALVRMGVLQVLRSYTPLKNLLEGMDDMEQAQALVRYADNILENNPEMVDLVRSATNAVIKHRVGERGQVDDLLFKVHHAGVVQNMAAADLRDNALAQQRVAAELHEFRPPRFDAAGVLVEEGGRDYNRKAELRSKLPAARQDIKDAQIDLESIKRNLARKPSKEEQARLEEQETQAKRKIARAEGVIEEHQDLEKSEQNLPIQLRKLQEDAVGLEKKKYDAEVDLRANNTDYEARYNAERAWATQVESVFSTATRQLLEVEEETHEQRIVRIIDKLEESAVDENDKIIARALQVRKRGEKEVVAKDGSRSYQHDADQVERDFQTFMQRGTEGVMTDILARARGVNPDKRSPQLAEIENVVRNEENPWFDVAATIVVVGRKLQYGKPITHTEYSQMVKYWGEEAEGILAEVKERFPETKAVLEPHEEQGVVRVQAPEQKVKKQKTEAQDNKEKGSGWVSKLVRHKGKLTVAGLGVAGLLASDINFPLVGSHLLPYSPWVYWGGPVLLQIARKRLRHKKQ